MSASPEALSRTWFAKVWNEGSEAAIHEMLAVDAKMHGLTAIDGETLIGPAGFVPFWRTLRAAFPDIQITVERVVEQGDMVAVRCRVSGRHTGGGLPIAATNKPIEIWGIGMAQVRDGKFVETWNSFDFMTLYQQIGMLPSLG